MGEKGKDEGIDPTRIESAIVEIRNQRVILDSDLAKLYGVETKRLNEQVKLNTAKFGEGYAFRLTKEEFDALKSQSATSNPGRGGRRYPPWAFTEHRVAEQPPEYKTKKPDQVEYDLPMGCVWFVGSAVG